jgi:hypothetical protein
MDPFDFGETTVIAKRTIVFLGHTFRDLWMVFSFRAIGDQHLIEGVHFQLAGKDKRICPVTRP